MIIILTAIIIFIIIIVWYSRIPNLDGFWEATDAFLSRSGTTVANAYISNDRIYLIIRDAEGTLLNKETKWSRSHNYATFDEDVAPLQQFMRIRYDPSNGLLGFFDDDTLMLELVRNNKISLSVKN